MKVNQTVLILSIVAGLGTSAEFVRPQALAFQGGPFPAETRVASGQPYPPYERPTHRTKLVNYAFDTFGPYPIGGAVLAAGISQWSDTPPEWEQGAEGFGKRFASAFGMAAVGTTTRYALSEAFREDTLYYRCGCRGIMPRVSHAAISTLTARRGQDGHRSFSFAALVAPYAGATAAVYAWYPGRFGAKDAFRFGNYNLLTDIGNNIALEFLYSGPHSLLSRMHLNNKHGAPDPAPEN